MGNPTKEIKEWSFKERLVARLPAVVLVLLIIQPVLDVFSYFLMQIGSNGISTLLRLALLGAVALLGFYLSPAKRLYLIFYGAVVLFWGLHMFNCFRLGYRSPFEDTSNFLRVLNFPVLTTALITVVKQGPAFRKSVYLGCAINFGEVLLFTALPWLLGTPIYTYSALELGVMGWFGVPNAQCVIIVLLMPFLIYWAYNTGKYWLFLVCVTVSGTLLFFTGTKFTFYSILIVYAAFIFLFVLRKGKKSLRFILPLFVLLMTVVLLRDISPMQQRESRSADTRGNYTSKLDEALESSGADSETILALKTGAANAYSWKGLEKNRKSLLLAYTDPESYGGILSDLNERFGVYRVMEQYDYTVNPAILSDFRIQKQNFSELVWAEKDFLTHLLGFEYSEVLAGESNYDPENDFPAIFYMCGYVGFTLYMGFFLYFLFIVLKAMAAEIHRCWTKEPKATFKTALVATGKGFRNFMTIETGVVGMAFLLALIAGQISGNVLRRPNVTIYIAVIAAYLHYLMKDFPARKWEKEEDSF